MCSLAIIFSLVGYDIVSCAILRPIFAYLQAYASFIENTAKMRNRTYCHVIYLDIWEIFRIFRVVVGGRAIERRKKKW